MKLKQLKHVHITALEWFDKVNGNSYFSAVVTLIAKNETEEIKIPFQYGYGNHYEEVCLQAIFDRFPRCKEAKSRRTTALWRFVEDRKICRTGQKLTALKRDCVSLAA